MRKNLTKKINELYFYKNGKKNIVNCEDKSTYPKNIYGDINSGLYGDISGLSGDISRLYGDATNIRGSLDDCGIKQKNRNERIKINDLVKS